MSVEKKYSKEDEKRILAIAKEYETQRPHALDGDDELGLTAEQLFAMLKHDGNAAS